MARSPASRRSTRSGATRTRLSSGGTAKPTSSTSPAATPTSAGHADGAGSDTVTRLPSDATSSQCAP